MGFWNRFLAVFRNAPHSSAARSGEAIREESKPLRAKPVPPSLEEMRTKLRAGMSRDEFFAVLDEIVVERGLSLGLPTADDRLVSLPVLEGGELLCFLPEGKLTYVEYKGGIFLEVEISP